MLRSVDSHLNKLYDHYFQKLAHGYKNNNNNVNLLNYTSCEINYNINIKNVIFNIINININAF